MEKINDLAVENSCCIAHTSIHSLRLDIFLLLLPKMLTHEKTGAIWFCPPPLTANKE